MADNNYITVREAVEKKLLSERDCLYVGYLLAIELKRILYETKGGGYFNVNPDTVKVQKVEGEEIRVELVDADRGHEACNGKPDFDTEVLNPCFCAPESFLGRFSPTSDVYSLGMLLAFMLTGTFPYDINESMHKNDILKVVKETKPKLDISAPMCFIAYKVVVIFVKLTKKNVMNRG